MDKERNRGEVLVKVEGLSKKFCKDLRTSLWYGLQDLYHNLASNEAKTGLREKEFWALRDINFELKRGECLGLIGHNGAGKSTLLKILNGLINPDEGRITVKGRVGAMIELGAGFNPILSGRENIYNNGAILGLTRAEINAKLNDIIEFAELEEFIDMPVQHYSSGMKVRLGFAVAAQMEPDVLLIDEVLAVGDLGFTLKCFQAMDALIPDTAIIFVSHSMPMVSRVCTKLLLLEKGMVDFFGVEVSQGIDVYYNKFISNNSSTLIDIGLISLKFCKIVNPDFENGGIPGIRWGNDLRINFQFLKHQKLKFIPFFLLVIIDKEQRPVALICSDETSRIEISDGYIEFFMSLENLQLSKGTYTIDIIVQKSKKLDVVLSLKSALSFSIDHPDDVYPPFLLASTFSKDLRSIYEK